MYLKPKIILRILNVSYLSYILKTEQLFYLKMLVIYNFIFNKLTKLISRKQKLCNIHEIKIIKLKIITLQKNV